MHLASRHGLKVIKALTPLLLVGSFGLCVAVMLPGVGVTVNGATRWLGAGPLQFQPSELLKLALVLYARAAAGGAAARDQDARRPRASRCCSWSARPALLLLKQPDMGTALVICFAIGALLIAAGRAACATSASIVGVAGRRWR